MEIDCNTARQMMRHLVSGCIEGSEINHTKLAEDATSELDLCEDHLRYVIPEDVFGLTLEFEVDVEAPGGWSWMGPGNR
ncbi:hypothetical protein LZC95_19750 [Pendulispora brunnea]|uniref:Uncharacterized protein n=1 Tax=Pendulispora brunnea TaxID=2905690 RepID=A0ABZ2KK53_9BACT